MKHYEDKNKEKILHLLCLSKSCVKNRGINTYLDYCFEHDNPNIPYAHRGQAHQRHHIIPKSVLKTTPYNQNSTLVNGRNINRVMLTKEEHIRAHELLNNILKPEYKKLVNYTNTIDKLKRG